MAKGDRTLALKLAAKFQRLGGHAKPIRCAPQASLRPDFSTQLGWDLEAIQRDGISAVRTGITSLAGALVTASVVLTAAIICAGAAGADPSQQDQFVALLEQEEIPPVDNVPALVARAHQICGELDGGTSVETVVNDEMNSAFGDNPVLHLYTARVRKTAVRFITASVDVYCPSHQGQLP